jgi:hypothetical protein
MVSGLVACGGGEPDAHTPPPPPSAAPSSSGPSQADMDAKKKADDEAAAKKKADDEAAAKKKADDEAAKKAEQAKTDLVAAFAAASGKFMLAYDKSDALKKAKDDDCDKNKLNKTDDKKAACKKAAADDAARMGARMSKDAKNDKMIFIELFTTDAKGKETVQHKFQVTPTVTGGSAKLAVADKTKDMGSPMTSLKAAPKELTVTAMDGMMLSIESADWPLGKLVFTKS